jgi:hypothetical protein
MPISPCFLPDEVLDQLEEIRKRFPSMARRVQSALRQLPHEASPPLTQVPPGDPNLLARYVPNPEARSKRRNPGPAEEPAEELAPDYVIVYEPFRSWMERRRRKTRCLVVRILSAEEAGGKYWTDPPPTVL